MFSSSSFEHHMFNSVISNKITAKSSLWLEMWCRHSRNNWVAERARPGLADLLNLRFRTQSSRGAFLPSVTENLDGLRTGLAPLHFQNHFQNNKVGVRVWVTAAAAAVAQASFSTRQRLKAFQWNGNSIPGIFISCEICLYSTEKSWNEVLLWAQRKEQLCELTERETWGRAAWCGPVQRYVGYQSRGILLGPELLENFNLQQSNS